MTVLGCFQSNILHPYRILSTPKVFLIILDRFSRHIVEIGPQNTPKQPNLTCGGGGGGSRPPILLQTGVAKLEDVCAMRGDWPLKHTESTKSDMKVGVLG